MIRVTYEVIEKDSSFKISFDGTTIRLEGFLKGNEALYGGEYHNIIEDVLARIDRRHSGLKKDWPKPHWVVDGMQCQATEHGIKNWTDSVSDQLPGHQLHYLASPFSEAVRKSKYYQKYERDHTFD